MANVPQNYKKFRKLQKICEEKCIFAYIIFLQYLCTTFQNRQHMNPEIRKIIIRCIVAALVAVASVLGAAFGLTSCRVNRTITTETSCIQRGDSIIKIQCKTAEIYNAKKNN